jgi:hypothetical protein
MIDGVTANDLTPYRHKTQSRDIEEVKPCQCEEGRPGEPGAELDGAPRAEP